MSDSEIAQYLMDDASSKWKEQVWLEVNKDYLEAQAEKARLQAELALAHPTRERKKRQRPIGTAATASEAVEIALGPRKSARFSQDMLRSLFDEEAAGSSSGAAVAMEEDGDELLLPADGMGTGAAAAPLVVPAPDAAAAAIAQLTANRTPSLSVSATVAATSAVHALAAQSSRPGRLSMEHGASLLHSQFDDADDADDPLDAMGFGRPRATVVAGSAVRSSSVSSRSRTAGAAAAVAASPGAGVAAGAGTQDDGLTADMEDADTSTSGTIADYARTQSINHCILTLVLC